MNVFPFILQIQFRLNAGGLSNWPIILQYSANGLPELLKLLRLLPHLDHPHSSRLLLLLLLLLPRAISACTTKLHYFLFNCLGSIHVILGPPPSIPSPSLAHQPTRINLTLHPDSGKYPSDRVLVARSSRSQSLGPRLPLYPSGRTSTPIHFPACLVMSSGFVSAGTNEAPVERDDEWLKAQQELEEERRRKAEIGKQNDGKSLYEVLQQNKSEFLSCVLVWGCNVVWWTRDTRAIGDVRRIHG